MDSFVSEIFDNKRDDPVALPEEIGLRADRSSQEFKRFLDRNPSGLAKISVPPNLLSDLYDPVYEEGPLLCKKVRNDQIFEFFNISSVEIRFRARYWSW